MKKILISLSMMCLGLCPTQAEVTDISTIDNVIYLNPVTASAGSQCVLSVQMKNTVAIAGYEFYLSVPEGITFAKDEENFLLTSLSEARTTSKKTNFFDSTIDENGLLHVLCSTSAGTNADDPSLRELYTFSGNDGEVCTITINIPSDIEVGTYPLVLSNIVLSNSSGDNGYETERVETTLTIEQNDGRLHFSETSTTLPPYTPGEKADVTMHRTIKANQWSTIVFPFNLTKKNAEAVFGSDVQFAQFSGFSVDYGDDEENVVPLGITINLVNYTIPTRGNLAGGTPVLIKTSKDIDEIQIDNVTLTNGLEEVSKSDEYGTPGKLTGTLVKTVIPADGLFISDNKFWYSTGKTNVKAFRCWFELGAVLNQETDFGSRINLKFTDEDETTGISSVKSHQKGMSFDLQGRKVTKVTKKGIYIENGKKKIVK